MDEDFSIHQRSTGPKKQPSKPKESTNKSKDIKIKKETLQLILVLKKKMIVTG